MWYPSVLAGLEDKGGLIQAVLAAQGGGRIMKILVVPPAEGRSAAMPVVEKGDGDPLRGGAEEEVGQAQLLHPGEGLELAALHEAQAVREGVLDLSRGEAKPGQPRAVFSYFSFQLYSNRAGAVNRGGQCIPEKGCS